MSQLLEEILSRDNMMRAYKRVVANKGASGVDGITTDEVRQYLIENWEIVGREYFNGVEQDRYPLDQMLFEIDASQPADQQLGEERIKQLLNEEN